MRICCILLFIGCWIGGAYANSDLVNAIEQVRLSCNGISQDLTEMKKIAGISTAVTGVGAVSGGVALGTGIAKTGVDKEADEIEAELKKLQELATQQDVFALKPINIDWSLVTNDGGDVSEIITDKETQLEQLTDKSKKLGNVRTGTLATSAVTNIVGAVMSGTNTVKGDLQSKIDVCLTSVKNLSNVRIQAQLSETATDIDVMRAEKIINACNKWGTVDVVNIDKKASGATISGGVGAGLGVAGTVTSAIANTDSVRSDSSVAGIEKEKKLNTIANVLAGGTTIASVTATVFNATQISAIKRAVVIADECEEALQ